MSVGHRWWVAAIFAGGIAGCSPGSAVEPVRISVQTAHSSYVAGDSVVISISNLGDHSVGIALCPVYLERRIGPGWMSPENGSVHACVALGVDLQPGATVQTRMSLPSNLASGTYHYRFELDDLPRNASQSNAFQVDGRD